MSGSWRLRPGQEAVVGYTGGYLAVPAVPGAGKTTALAHLAARLIAEGGVGKGRILVVTYQNSGVSNFRERIGTLLQERGLPPARGYEVRTIHSLAAQILRRRPERRLLPERPLILDEASRDQVLRDEVRRWRRNHPETLQNLLDPRVRQDLQVRARWEEAFPGLVRQIVAHCKAHRLAAAPLAAQAGKLPADSFLRPALEVYAAYEAALRREGALDFDDLLVHAYELLRGDPEFLERLRRRWPFVFEDEAQDSSPLQEELLTLLAGPEGNLVRVGDANQAIMSTFTNAEPDLFRRFCRRPEVLVRSLRESGRSSRDIIDLANHFMRWVREEHPWAACRDALEEQTIQPVAPDDPHPNPDPPGYHILTRRFASQAEEMEHVVGRLPRALAAPGHTVAVLFPTNRQAEDFARLLERRGIPYRTITRTRPEQQRLAQGLGDLLDFLAAPHDREALGRAVAGLLPEAGADAAWQAALRATAPEELLFPLEDRAGRLPAPAVAAPLAAQLEGLLRRLGEWLEMAWSLPPDALLLQLAEELDLEEADAAVLQAVALEVRRRLARDPQLDLVQLGPQVRELVRQAGHVAAAVYDRQGFRAEAGVVYVTTFHKAKGLEWDTVYLMQLNEGEFPSTPMVHMRGDLDYLGERFRPDRLARRELSHLLGDEALGGEDLTAVKEEEIRERLRLLYVGITRARENLFLGTVDPSRGMAPSQAFRALEEAVRRRGEVRRERA